MRSRSMLAVIPLLIALGCVDTAEPTGPQPNPNPDEGGEVIGSTGAFAQQDGATAETDPAARARRR